MESNIDTKQAALDAAFIKASLAGDLKAAKIALDKGANINAMAPLGMPAILGSKEIMELCIERGGIHQHVLDTALLFCFSYNNKEGVEMLLKAGADIGLEVTTIPLFLTAVFDIEMLGICIRNGKPSQDLLNHACYYAISGGRAVSASLLVKAGAKLPPEDIVKAAQNAKINPSAMLLFLGQKDAALIEACKAGDFEAAEISLNNGASVNYEDANGSSGLAHALNNKAIVELLLKQKGITQETKDKALDVVKLFEDAEAEGTALILKEGANPNAIGGEFGGMSLVVRAIHSPKTLKAFLETGKVEKAILDEALGCIVYHYLEREKSDDALKSIKLLSKAGAELSTYYMLEAVQNNPEILELLKQYKADVVLKHEAAPHSEQPTELKGGMEEHYEANSGTHQ